MLFVKDVNNGIASIGKKIREQVESIDIEKIANAISIKINSYSEDMKLVLVLLGQREWFVSFDMPAVQVIQLKEHLIDEENDEVDMFMVSYFNKKLEKIENDIISYFPHRGKIISSAFNAHRRGEYELSIPTMLSQADGICNELTEKQLYSRKKQIPRIGKYIEQVKTDVFLSSILAPICAPMPINANPKERDLLADDILNRHTILHGEIVNYGTEINSLKTISYLSYVVNALILVKYKIEP